MFIVRYQGEVGTPVAGGLRERGERKKRDGEEKLGKRGKEREGKKKEREVEIKRLLRGGGKRQDKDWKHEVIQMLRTYRVKEKTALIQT